MCDPVTLLAGVAASTAGGMMSSSNQLSNAAAQAQAANNILATKQDALKSLYDANTQPFDALLSSYSPTAQGAALTGDQNARTQMADNNITSESPNILPLDADASPAIKQAYATQLGDALNYAKTYAQNEGNLNGYQDEWFNNNLNTNAANRAIGVNDAQATDQQQLIAPEQQAAEAAAYKPPSPIGGLLQGAGNILGAASGSSNAGSNLSGIWSNITQPGYTAAGGVTGFASP